MDTDVLLKPGEVAELFVVDAKTVTRWADVGRINSLRTLGGHRRFRARDVRDLLVANGATQSEAEALIATVLRKRAVVVPVRRAG